MLWSRPPSSIRKPTDPKDKGDLMWMGSVGQELHHLEKERAIQTDPEETRRRRTIQLIRKEPQSSSWGFTLQTYGIQNKRNQEVEVMTYVDYVELHGPAWIAGMRRGDVLLSVNGESVEGLNHPQLVARIQLSKDTLRLVVLFEDCCRRVELYERFIKLKRILSQKKRDLRQLEYEEQLLCSGGRLSRVGLFRDSIRSSTSSDWDCYSEVASPGVIDSVAPNQQVWRQRFFARSTDTLDTSSELSYEYPSPFGSSRESLNGASRENWSQKDSSSNSTGEKTSEISVGAEHSNGACGVDPELSASSKAETSFYIDPDDHASDSESPTLRRAAENSQTEPHPGGRKRSNSTLLNDMRMKLLADAFKTEASKATNESYEEQCEETESKEEDEGYEETIPENQEEAVEHNETEGQVKRECEGLEITRDCDDNNGVSDSEIIILVDEDNVPCRLYKGIRINDSDELTRL